MKRLTALLLAVSMLMTLCACGGAKEFKLSKVQGVTDLDKVKRMFGEPDSDLLGQLTYEDITFQGQTGTLVVFYDDEASQVENYAMEVYFENTGDEFDAYFSKCTEFLSKEYGEYTDNTEKNGGVIFNMFYTWRTDDGKAISLTTIEDDRSEPEVRVSYSLA